MSCTKCGCRMVTKVGRTSTMLICSDCGHPRAELHRPHRIAHQRWVTAAFLVAVAGLALAMSRMRYSTSAPSEPARNNPADVRTMLKEDL
jgi:hypothetical protein